MTTIVLNLFSLSNGRATIEIPTSENFTTIESMLKSKGTPPEKTLEFYIHGLPDSECGLYHPTDGYLMGRKKLDDECWLIESEEKLSAC